MLPRWFFTFYHEFYSSELIFNSVSKYMKEPEIWLKL